MAVQYKVVFPNLFLLHLSTFHTHIKKLNNASNEGSAKSSASGALGSLDVRFTL